LKDQVIDLDDTPLRDLTINKEEDSSSSKKRRSRNKVKDKNRAPRTRKEKRQSKLNQMWGSC